MTPFIDSDTAQALALARQKMLQQQQPAAATPSQGIALAPRPVAQPAQPGVAPAIRSQTPPAGPTPSFQPPSPAQAELTRLTAPHQTGILAHTQADTGQSGIGQIHNPLARGALTALDTIGQVLPFFRRIEPLIPGTAGHHAALVGQQQGLVSNEAKTGLEQAQARHANAEAESLEQPDEKTGKPVPLKAGEGLYDLATKRWLVEPTDPEKTTEITEEVGKHLGIQPTKDGKYLLPKGGAALLKPEKETEPKTVAELAIHQNPHISPEELQALLAKPEKEKGAPKFSAEDAALIRAEGGDPDRPETLTLPILRKYIADKQMPQRPPQILMVPQGGGTAEVVRPGTNVGGNMVTPQQAGQAVMPTVQMKNAAAQATLVHEKTPEVLSELDRLKDKLGPVQGRWNEFMQGKVGMKDPDFAGLRGDLLMYSSGVALMHARGRLPENLRKEFDDVINAPEQDFDNLKAVITKVDDWAQKNINVMRGAGGEPAQAPATKIRKYNQAKGGLESPK